MNEICNRYPDKCCYYNPSLDNCILGEGIFGLVSKINCNTYNLRYCKFAAKKVLNIREDQPIEDIENEIKILNILKNKSPYIINLYRRDPLSDGKVTLYLQLINGYDLLDYYKLDKINTLNKEIFITGLVNGLKIIHENNILHCDIKPENILINTNVTLGPIPVYIDFGLAIIVEDANEGGWGWRQGGTKGYYIEKEEDKCTVRSDIFALFKVLLIVYKGDMNFGNELGITPEIVNEIMNNKETIKNFNEICELFPNNTNKIVYKESKFTKSSIISKFYTYLTDKALSVSSRFDEGLYYLDKVLTSRGKNKRKKLTKKKPVKKRRYTKRRRPIKRRRAGKSS